MDSVEFSGNTPALYRQAITNCGNILGVAYEVDFAAVYLSDGSFYLEYPDNIRIVTTGGVELSEPEIELLKERLLHEQIENLKRAPYYTTWFFGLRYIPNPDFDPDFDPTINPLEKWG